MSRSRLKIVNNEEQNKTISASEFMKSKKFHLEVILNGQI